MAGVRKGMTMRYLWWYTTFETYARWYFLIESSLAVASALAWAAFRKSSTEERLLSMSPSAADESLYSFWYQSPYWATKVLLPAALAASATDANAVPRSSPSAAPATT